MTDAEASARRVVDVFATGDLAAIPAAIAPHYVDHQGLDDEEIRGRDGFARVVEAARSGGALGVEILDLVAADDRAAIRIRWTHGELVRETLDLLRFENGLLAEHWGAELRRGADR